MRMEDTPKNIPFQAGKAGKKGKRLFLIFSMPDTIYMYFHRVTHNILWISGIDRLWRKPYNRTVLQQKMLNQTC